MIQKHVTFAVGVLAALKMYASWICRLAEGVALKWRWTWDKRCFEAEEELLREDMAERRDMMRDWRWYLSGRG